jgi:HD-GYP domain-containing protein (c-di-GMP phosphodiesterase class II)
MMERGIRSRWRKRAQSRELPFDPTRPETELLFASTLVFAIQGSRGWWSILDHCTSVAATAARIAGEAGIADDDDLGALTSAARLHEIGAIGIPRELMARPGPLAPRELERIRSHAAIGAEIARPTCGNRVAWLIEHQFSDFTDLRDIYATSDIDLLLAGILRVADVVIAITEPRPYRSGPARVDWRDALNEGFGAAFHPAAAGMMLNVGPAS